MKRFFVLIFTVIVILSMAAPVMAVTPNLPIPDLPEIPDISDDIDFGIDFDEIIKRWLKEHPIGIIIPINPSPVTPKPIEPTPTEPEPTVTELDAPVISSARYVHRYFQRLEIKWNAVENTESYLIEIAKDDGTVDVYEAKDSILCLTDVDCPKTYIEETNTWAAASVRVMAVRGDITSEWSELKAIGCDMIH